MENHNNNNNINVYNELLKSIEHWNEYRVPILRISQPDKNLTFQGAMRFYFQESGQKVATKCVNVTSNDTTKDVIDVLIEKFRPDMRMLSVPEYGLYEIHESGDEIKLGPYDRPLLVQLEWNKDDREGRFLLRRMDEKTREFAPQNEEPSLKRKLSKREKKKQDKLKKQQQKDQEKANAAANKSAAKGKSGIAERLYNELPETSFTRSISNPEAVMKRRRAQKLERRLQEFSLEGGQEAGGTLRIFGETINKDVSYKTLLISKKDTASFVVKQILEKYGKVTEDPSDYCLVQLIVPPSATSGGDNNSVHDLNTSASLRESTLDDNDFPLLINQNHEKSRGILTFHIRHKPADYQKRRKKKQIRAQGQPNPLHPLVVQQLNQRLQINNNAEQYSNQNSPYDSSQTSGSISHDPNNPPPPPFESVHSMPTIFPATNGNMMSYQQQSISAATLPPRMNNHMNNNSQDNHDAIHRQNYSQPNIKNVVNQPNKSQFSQNQMVPNNYNNPFKQVPHQQQQMQQKQQYMHPSGANDKILPALIQVREDVEDIFLDRVITQIKPTDTEFRLAPTFVLYMVSRYRASTLFHPELQAPSRAELFVPFTKKIATMVRRTIEDHMGDPSFLAFWLANSSDLSHIYKQDKHLSHFTIDAQEILYDSIKASFRYLLACKHRELDNVLPSFFDEHQANGNSSINQILNVLDDTMANMRKDRVNAALTIQIFSHLFHHMSKWLFDRLIGVYDRQPNNMMGPNFAMYCNRVWGEKLDLRLAMIVDWAEKQGLEQAAYFHLARVSQVTLFLARPYPRNISSHDLEEAIESCDRLNRIQMKSLLQRYQPEQPILRDIIDKCLYDNYSYLGGDYQLEEDFELKIPFLIPDDGYLSELTVGIPKGLLNLVSYLSNIRVGDQELCIFTVQPTSSGSWTVYLKNHQPDTPEIIVIQLRKKNHSMGLSIIAARGVGQERLGIYIKNVVKNGAAAMDGRLQAGDQLLEVDGNSLQDITQEMAAELMQKTGQMVTLKIARQAATYHNLSDIINSVPTHNIVAPQPNVVIQQQQNFIPRAPVETMQPLPQPERKQPNMQPQIQPVERHLIRTHPIEMQPDPRLLQLQLERQQQQNSHQLLQPDRQLLGMQQIDKTHHLLPDRMMMHQQPPATIFEESSPTSLGNPTSPLKSPKKVSWVDNQPHQSLHTLIPPSPALVPSPIQMPSPPPEIPSPSQLDDSYHHQFNNDAEDDSQNYMNNHIDSNSSNINNGHLNMHEITNGHMSANLMNDPHRYNHDNGRESDQKFNMPTPLLNGQQSFDDADDCFNSQLRIPEPTNTNSTIEQPNTNGINNNNQSLDATAESLTLEDIDEVLSSKTHNNWLEDSAGVIGTQEVYNDPRQRIVKERERPNADVNIEKLSFQEKLKMFNISARK